MKKLLIATNILFLSIIIYQSCAPTRAVVTAAICPPCKSYAGVQFPGLTTSTATLVSENYKRINQPLLALGTNGSIPDANSIWFSLETLKSFIWNIENAACQTGCYKNPNSLNLGVRIYYARYPDDNGMASTADLSSLPNSSNGSAALSFASHHTIFMVPTFQDANDATIQWDFDPWHWSTSTTASNGCIEPTSMAQWFVDTIAPFGSNRSLILSQVANYPPSTSQTSTYNHGDMIPPGTRPPPPTGPGY